ncbi:MAG: histone deacetylase family protein [Salinisphaera sp.]|nr:histone deacetylase family protein [Salinisphaera sp.]
MMRAYFTHHACAGHDAGPMHPECPQRLSAVHDTLAAAGLLDVLHCREAAPARLDDLVRVHDRAYVDRIIQAAPTRGRIALDPDTSMGPGSLDAALAAAGAAQDAVQLVLDDSDVPRAFCNIRPPGHHAEYGRAMGFCLFNNVALAAFTALDAGVSSVAILDFDVHHGNGTEDIVRRIGDERVLYASSFQHPLYPFSSLDGIPGRIIKTPLDAGTDGDGFRVAITRDWLEPLARFAPGLVLFSAGFDAHAADPLAGLQLTAENFAWVTTAVIEAVGAHVPVVSMLEGGYDLPALGASAVAHVKAL